MGLFDFFKKKKQPKESVTMEEYIKIRKDEGGSDDDIKEEIMEDFKSKMFGDKSSVSLDDDDDEENSYMDTLPTPKGNYTENNIEELWDKSNLIEFDTEEGDLDSVERWKDLEKTEKENYYYGKKVYEEKYGELVGSSLKDVIRNLNEMYLTEYYEDDDYKEIVKDNIGRMGEHYKDWNLWFYGGKHMVSTTNDGEEVVEEGYEKSFRRKICKSKEIITDDELIDFNSTYYNNLTLRYNKLEKVTELKRIINKEFCIPLKEKKYKKDTKDWIDFDIYGVFLRVRGLMIDIKNPLPHYVWKLIDGNPFDRVYRICRDYMKWKGNKKTTQIVFDNVCKWENGEIYREEEPSKEYEHPLWINWNKVGKDFLSMKTKLKKEKEGGLEWLKDDVGGYIKDRKNFYNSFGEESEFFISDELIGKFESIK